MSFEISFNLRFLIIWDFMSFNISCHYRFHFIWDFISYEIRLADKFPPDKFPPDKFPPGGTCPKWNLSGGNLSFLDACLPGELVRGEIVQNGTCPQGHLSGGNLSASLSTLARMVWGTFFGVPVSPWSWAHCKCAGLGTKSVSILEICCAFFVTIHFSDAPVTLRRSPIQKWRKEDAPRFFCFWHNYENYARPFLPKNSLLSRHVECTENIY